MLNAMLAKSPPLDFITEFAEPVSLTVACELLSVPYTDRGRFRTWMQSVVTIGEQKQADALHARQEFFTYLRGHADRKWKAPRGDLLTEMVTRHDADGAGLTEAEIVTMGATIIVAGLATANFMGRGILWVLRCTACTKGSAQPELDTLPHSLRSRCALSPRRDRGAPHGDAGCRPIGHAHSGGESGHPGAGFSEPGQRCVPGLSHVR
ncbi:hypothetical protein ACH41H_45785 [Streptomyces sp. NPDC020800]|uniref:hypothetical protein n=1 Tax=Streptomyces sp. NPDC020800 TaxID=3365092 RepID=UPI00378DA674